MSEDLILKLIGICIWPASISTALVVVGLCFRKGITNLLSGRDVRVKHGDTEVNVTPTHDGSSKKDRPQEEPEQEAPPEEEPAADIKQQVSEQTPDQLSVDMIDAFLTERDAKKGRAVFARLQEVEQDSGKRLENKALLHYLEYARGDVKALASLESLTEVPEAAASAHSWLGRCFTTAGDLRKAADHFGQTLKLAKSPTDTAHALISLAHSIYGMGKKDEALETIMSEADKHADPTSATIIFKGLADIFKKEGDWIHRAAALEKALEFSPNSASLLFQAAYAFGKAGLEPLAMRHYRTLVQFKADHPDALNNLGVAYARLDLPSFAVAAYEKAVVGKNTLASANLAGILIKAGLASKASKLLNEARRQEDVHPNVGRLLAELADTREAATERRKEIEQRASHHQRFFHDYASRRFLKSTPPAVFAGKWRSEKGAELDVEEADGRFYGSLLSHKEGKQVFSGETCNNAAELNVQKATQNILTETESLSPVGKGWCYLSEDGQHLSVLVQEEDETDASMLSLTRAV